MIIDYIEMAGFRSCREKVRIELGSGVTVVTGRNGVGKSTIIDAVEFALTGTISKYKVERAKGGGLAAHTWWVGETPAEQQYVEVAFQAADGTRHLARRSPQEPEPNLTELTNILLRTQHDRSLSTTKLCQTMILRDEQISELSLDLTERERFQAVLNAISPDTAPDIASKLDDVVKLASNDLNMAAQQRETLRTRLSAKLEELAELRGTLPSDNALSNAEADRRAAEEQVRTIAPSLDFADGQGLPALLSHFSAAQELHENIKLHLSRQLEIDLEAQNTRLDAVGAEINSLTEELELLRENIAIDEQHLSSASEISAQIRHLAIIVEHGEELGLEDGHCPLCTTPHTPTEFKAAIEKQREKISEAAQAQALLQDRITQNKDRAGKIAKRLGELREERENIRFAIRKREGEAENIARNAESLGLSAFASDPDGLLAWMNEVRLVGSKLRESETRIASSQSLSRISSLEQEIEHLRTQIDKSAGTVAMKDSVLERSKSLSKLAKAFPREILEEQFETVMPLLKELYSRLRPHIDWHEIEYDFGGQVMASLNFKVGDGKNPQFLFSSGQRRATGLAFLLAVYLAREWTNLRTLMLDDPVQHIDDYRALNLVEVLAAIRREKRQIIIAVEDPALAELLARRLRGVADDSDMFYEIGIAEFGGSYIKEERHLPPLSGAVLAPPIAS